MNPATPHTTGVNDDLPFIDGYFQPTATFAPAAGLSYGKMLHKPPEYTGKDRSGCSSFIAQTKLYISGNNHLFPTEESKVLFAATYLRDRAFQWFEPKMLNDEDPALHNFSLFCRSLMNALGDPSQGQGTPTNYFDCQLSH